MGWKKNSFSEFEKNSLDFLCYLTLKLSHRTLRNTQIFYVTSDFYTALVCATGGIFINI